MCKTRMEGKLMNKMDYIVSLIKEYAEQNRTPARSTSDLSPFEEWLLVQLYNKEIIDNNEVECIIHGCTNKKSEGVFTGNICNPCYKLIIEGKINKEVIHNTQRVDNNELFKLVSNLISAGFRGSSQKVVDKDIESYNADIKNKCNTCVHDGYGNRCIINDCSLNGYSAYCKK